MLQAAAAPPERDYCYCYPIYWSRPMRDLIKLTCQDCKRDNYVTDKNKRTQTEKFEIKSSATLAASTRSTKKARSRRAELLSAKR